MTHHSYSRGGIFQSQLEHDEATRDVSLFPTVGYRNWPPGPRTAVESVPPSKPIGFKNIGMGDYGGPVVPQKIGPKPQPMDPQSVMVGRLPQIGYPPASGHAPHGFTSKGGIFDGSTVDPSQPGDGMFFEEKSPRTVKTGVSVSVLPDPMLALRNIGQTNITPTPGPINGFGQATMPSRPIPVSVHFAHPRMYGKSVFMGPVIRDRFPRESIMPSMGPINGFGAGPDGLGSSCGCGSWKTSR